MQKSSRRLPELSLYRRKTMSNNRLKAHTTQSFTVEDCDPDAGVLILRRDIVSRRPLTLAQTILLAMVRKKVDTVGSKKPRALMKSAHMTNFLHKQRRNCTSVASRGRMSHLDTPSLGTGGPVCSVPRRVRRRLMRNPQVHVREARVAIATIIVGIGLVHGLCASGRGGWRKGTR